MKLKNKHQGFSLIEIAIVLIILSVALGGLVSSLASRMETANRDDVKKELKEIKQVVMAYAFTNNPPFLPCPDADVIPDGLENRNAGICVRNYGYLPWKTLGVGYADAWNNRYQYWVNSNYTNSALGFTLATDPNDTGSATVNTRVGNVVDVLLNNAVLVVFSYGQNAVGAVSANNVNQPPMPAVGRTDELENRKSFFGVNNIFIQRVPSAEGVDNDGGPFDDLLMWINSYELKAKMVEAGVLP